MVTNLVARVGDKLAFPAVIVCAGISKRLKDCKTSTKKSLRWTFYILQKFLELWSSNPWDLAASLQEVGGCTHAKHTRLHCFDQSAWIDLRSTFHKYRGGSRLQKGSTCDGLLNGRCYGNRFVARVGENWHTPYSFCALAFNNGWEYRNANCCINIDDDSSTLDEKFINFGPVTPESLLLICIDGWVHTWPKYDARCF